MISKTQKMKLNDGHYIPVLGFGTYTTEEVMGVVLGWRFGINTRMEVTSSCAILVGFWSSASPGYSYAM